MIVAAPGVSTEVVQGLARPGFQFISRPVAFRPLLPEVSVFVSYTPAASVTQAMLAGIPQLMAPAHVEAKVMVARVTELGAGVTFRGNMTEESIATTLRRVHDEQRLKVRAFGFANRRRTFDPAVARGRIVARLEQLAGVGAAREGAE